jgi:predicted lipoprotein with Yx(FWY)xxD motif
MNRQANRLRIQNMRQPLAIAALIASLALAACGGDGDSEGRDQPASNTGGQQSGGSSQSGGSGGSGKPGATITTAGSQYGPVLFDGDERAIYYFDKESSDRSECYGECAAAWPPVLTDGAPEAAQGASKKLLGTTERDDGSTQVTYDGRPLYYYVDDPRGEILCHGVDEFGGLWLAVQPDGNAVQ